MKFLFITLSLLALSIASAETISDQIIISNPVIRMVPPGSPNSAGFMKIYNNSNDDLRIIKIESDISRKVELHDVLQENGMMKMRKVDAFEIKSKTTLELKKGSKHIMFINLINPLKEGDKKKVKIHFQNGKSLEIEIPIQKL
ncbi:MAG: copper chaperone PCu(A)C [Leptospiraceae bacterium]|nr:copper chaperone PCu(A)C [Leptospiraceae bacterium]